MQWEFPLISLIKKIKTFLSAAPIYFWSVVKTPLNLGWESNCQKVEQGWFYRFPTHTLSIWVKDWCIRVTTKYLKQSRVCCTHPWQYHWAPMVDGESSWLIYWRFLFVSSKHGKEKTGNWWFEKGWKSCEVGWRMFWRLGCWSGDVPSPPFDQTPASLLTVNRLWSTTASTVSTPTKFLTGT